MEMEIVADQLLQRFLEIYELAFHFASSMIGSLGIIDRAVVANHLVIHQSLVGGARAQLVVSEFGLDEG
jgi:hypothetical protein